MEDSPKIMNSSSSSRISSKSSQSQGSADRRHFEIALDAEQRLSPDERIVGVRKFTPSSEKKLEQPQENVRTYRRLTPKESLEKIKADIRLKSMRLRFKFGKREPAQKDNNRQVEIKKLTRSKNSDMK